MSALSVRSKDLRRATIAIGALLLVALWLFGRESEWSVRIAVDESTVAPWTPVTLTAEIAPAHARGGARGDRESGWSWKWSATTGVISGTGSSVELKTGTPGEHRVHVIVRSPRGTEHTADAVVTVKRPEFLAGLGSPLLVGPAEDDPIPDVVRPDLPFRIVDVTVDKPVVCRGERATISVRATHDEGTADWLVPAIAGKIGWSVSVVVPGTKPGRYKIPVQVGDPDRQEPGTPVDYVQTGAFIVLEDCDKPQSLWVGVEQPSPTEEDVRFKVTILGGGGGGGGGNSSSSRDAPRAASYVWSFGDDSPTTTTTTASERHVFPSEEQRGPGKRIFSYVVSVEAKGDDGAVIATGKVDVSFRNHHEELKRSDRRLQLVVVSHPEPRTGDDGERIVDVTLKNLDASETANLTELEVRTVPCAADRAPKVERRPVSDVFPSSAVLPRGSLDGHLRLPKGAAVDACNVDVSIVGTSQPGRLTVGGAFSMRTSYDQGVDTVDDPEQSAAITRAMALLHKRYVIEADLEDLVKAGALSPAALKRPGGRPLPR